MRQYHKQYHEWICLPTSRVQRVPPAVNQIAGDTAPPCPFVCRWDGAVKFASHSAGGMVVMDQPGMVLMAKGFHFAGIDNPLLAEILSLWEAILWCSGIGFDQMRFEGDAKTIIDKINQADTRDSRVGALL
ncbi:unnamed protein product [Linum trigynum]|uniref:RNase H type-1 domain-containing protein n=1 Tax=Linum trigynum TaxID=586398 RepID=A0AAV2F5M7_9ROSI